MENMDIRLKARGAGIPLWKIAEHIGISEPTLTRWMRQTLSKEKKTQIITAIREIKEKDTSDRG